MKQLGRGLGASLLLLAALLLLLDRPSATARSAGAASRVVSQPSRLVLHAEDAVTAVGLAVAKVATPITANVGEVITYTVTITNIGDEAVENLQAVDDPLGALSLISTTLEPSETTTALVTYTVLEADLPGPLVNTVTVSGVASATTPVQASALATVALTSNPALSIAKIATPTLVDVGEMITYTYWLTNSGDVSLTGLTAIDDKLGAIPLNAANLAPGLAATGVATYVVITSDRPGPLLNTVIATGIPPVGPPITASAEAVVTLASGPALTVSKSVTPANANPGTTVTYTYAITNSGNVTLSNLAANDDRLGPITLTASTLAPGIGISAVRSYEVISADLPGPLVNTVVVTGLPPSGPPVSATATATVTFGSNPALAVSKTVSPTRATAGDRVTYTYRITNTGDMPLSALAAADDRLGVIALPATALTPGAGLTAVAAYTVTEADLPGPITNTVTVSGTPAVGAPVEARASTTLALFYWARMRLFKTPSVTTAQVGDVISYTYQVRNNGTVTLSGLTAMDDKLGPVPLDVAEIAPGRRARATLIYQVQEADLGGPLVNTLVVTGTTLWGVTVSETLSATVTLVSNPALSVGLSANVSQATVGETITYTYRVTNTGDVSLSAVSVNDNRFGAVVLGATTLIPGQSTTGRLAHVVTTADLPGPLTNTATATGTPPGGGPVTATANAAVVLQAPPPATRNQWLPLIENQQP
jgi:uncharacterized repeat protein (TIGR01451 family)